MGSDRCMAQDIEVRRRAVGSLVYDFHLLPYAFGVNGFEDYLNELGVHAAEGTL